MADVTRANVGDNAPKGDVSDVSKKEHCPHCGEHGKRIEAVEKYLGMKSEKGVKREETASRATRHATVSQGKVEKMRERARH
jgi:hypothetical protein